jgi:hypothetical protein
VNAESESVGAVPTVTNRCARGALLGRAPGYAPAAAAAGFGSRPTST